jgi:hypothetical protein
MKILLRDFNAKVGMEDIFKLTIDNERLHEIGDNGLKRKKLNSMALVCERTIPTEPLPLVGEVNAYFCG